MSKHKKTRKEKIIADHRHQVYILKNDTPINNSVITATVDGDSYFNTHILKDILKTGILSFSIIAIQIILFLLLKNHIIVLPMIRY